MGRGSGFPGCITLFPDIFKLVILFSNRTLLHILLNYIKLFAPAILYAFMDLSAKSDVVHGFALGSSVSDYD